jgi:hypothetical protein
VNKITNTSDLRKALIDSIDGIRDGSLKPSAANAIANLAGKILQSATTKPAKFIGLLRKR